MNFKKLVFASLLLALTASSASAAEIVLKNDPYAQERRITNVIFANYIQSLTGIQVESGLVDLDSDGKGEVVAKFIHSGACKSDMKSCRTVVLRHTGKNWKIILDRIAESLDTSKGYRNIPSPINVDNTSWTWKNDRYLPVVSSLGDRATLRKVSASAMEAYAPSFGSRTSRISNGFGISYSMTQEGISSTNDIMIVKMEGNVACGEVSGCPVRILKRSDDGWSPVLSSSTTGGVHLSKITRDGRRDIILETNDGALQLGWTGSTYALADRIEGIK